MLKNIMHDIHSINAWSRGKQLVFFSRESWCPWRGNIGTRGKTNLFPEGPDIKVCYMYYSFPKKKIKILISAKLKQQDVSSEVFVTAIDKICNFA